MKQAELVDEIERLIEESGRQAVGVAWIRHAILSQHRDVSGADADLALLCMFEHVSDTAESIVRRRKPTATERHQLVLPGYDYIQRRYVIERDGESMIVPVEGMTPSELREKAKEARKMGAGCYAHAEELDRLAEEREHAGEP